MSQARCLENERACKQVQRPDFIFVPVGVFVHVELLDVISTAHKCTQSLTHSHQKSKRTPFSASKTQQTHLRLQTAAIFVAAARHQRRGAAQLWAAPTLRPSLPTSPLQEASGYQRGEGNSVWGATGGMWPHGLFFFLFFFFFFLSRQCTER